jgi:hypothetical protein
MNEWQELLWSIPNRLDWWDVSVAVLAGLTALVSFFTLIVYHPLNALLAARSLVAVGLLMVAFYPLNSGALKPGLAVIVLGLAHSNFLLLTNWCNRAHPWRDALHAMLRMVGQLAELVAPRDRRGPHDTVALTRDGHTHTGKGD